jgi:hypothetical protein
MRAGCNPPLPSFINYATQLVCDVLARSDALSVMPFGAVKAPIEAGTISLVSTAADFQLPAYAIYKPIQAASDPVLECLENSILHGASTLEEARQTVETRRAPSPAQRSSGSKPSKRSGRSNFIARDNRPLASAAHGRARRRPGT